MAAPTPKADAMRALREQRHKAAVAAAAAGGGKPAKPVPAAPVDAPAADAPPATKGRGKGKAKPAGKSRPVRIPAAAPAPDRAAEASEVTPPAAPAPEAPAASEVPEATPPSAGRAVPLAEQATPRPAPGPAATGHGMLLAWQSGGNGPGLARRMPELSIPNPQAVEAPAVKAPAVAKRPAPAALAGPALQPLIAGGVLPLPAVLVLRYKGAEHRAGVNPAGQVVVEGHEPFDSPSRAALSLIDRQTINGWDAWRVESLDGAPKLTALRARLAG